MELNVKCCELCPNHCAVDRSTNYGFCKSHSKLKIAKFSLHPFEEPVISGTNGSGTIFFCGCSLKCVFCQNFEVSRGLVGKEISIDELVDIFKKLEDMGAHNINLVNPTHYSAQIVEALKIYRPNIPIVWNTHGYERVEVLNEVDPYIDIYLTDLKYFSPKVSMRYSNKENYFSVAKNAVEFMINSKKTVLSDGLMKSGVIIRHLILPLNTDDSIALLRWLRPIISNGAILSLMSQYTPFGDIEKFPELKRKITKREYKKVLNEVLDLEYEQVFTQDSLSSSEVYIPVWDY